MLLVGAELQDGRAVDAGLLVGGVDRPLQQLLDRDTRERRPAEVGDHPLAALRPGEVGDVLDEAPQPGRAAVLVVDGLGARGQQPHLAVGAPHPDATHPRAVALDRLARLAADAVQLVGIGDLQLVVRLRDAAERRVAAQQREQLGRVDDRLGVGVPRPPAERRHLLRAGEQLLALAQLDFGGPALGDVDDHRADHPLLAEAHRVVAGHPGAALARPGLGRAVELDAGHGLAGVAHAGDHRVDLGGQLRVEDLRQPAPQVLARGAAVDGGQRVGDEHEAQLLVVDREPDRRVRLQRLDERRGGERLLLAAHTHVATLVAASAAVAGRRRATGRARHNGGVDPFSVLGVPADRLGGGAGQRLPRARQGVAPGPARSRRRAPDGGDQRRLRAAARGRPAGAQRAPPGARRRRGAARAGGCRTRCGGRSGPSWSTR